jgi:hypothetical protein
MRAYFERYKAGHAANINFYTAYEGFLQMGFAMQFIDTIPQIPVSDDECVVVGSVGFIQQALDYFGKDYPKMFDYPVELERYLGRKVWTSTINKIDSEPENWNVFVKPMGYTKKFTGRVVQGAGDLIGTADQFNDTPVWVSEIVEFIAEWRVFVRYGRIIGVRPYKGDWRVQFDAGVIENAISVFESAPSGYALDFGVTKNGRTLLVEANDGYSLGSYGLYFIDYAKLLSARWSQLTAQKDLCNF